MAEKSKFEEELEKLNINLTEHQKEQFDRYYEMLVEWNNVMNLTGITDYDEVNLKHFTDSLTLVRNIDMNKIDAVIDIGTGCRAWSMRRNLPCAPIWSIRRPYSRKSTIRSRRSRSKRSSPRARSVLRRSPIGSSTVRCLFT